MTDLTSRLKNALAFDEAWKPKVGISEFDYYQRKGAMDEHARTQGLLLALVDAFDLLDVILSTEGSDHSKVRAAVLKELETLEGGT